MFGVQHDRCQRTTPEGQGRRVHKLCPLFNLPLPPITNSHCPDLLGITNDERRLPFEMTEGLAFGLTVAKSRIHGKGCFAAIAFGEHQQIAEYVGERIPLAEAERRRCTQGEKGICDIDSDWAIDGSRGGNGTHCINHSCQPNAYVIVSGRRIFIHALREIAPGEEITTDYRYELNSAQIKCRCQSNGCDEPTKARGIVWLSEERASENNRPSIPKPAAPPGTRL